MSTTRYGTSVRQRDIVLISFPYSDYSHEKMRPAVILSSQEHNANNQDVICCAITSNPRESRNSVDISNKDMESGFLKRESKIKPRKIFTINEILIEKKIARLSISKSQEVVSQISDAIRIPES